MDTMPPPSQHKNISVVMPVHNARPHLGAAIRSILEQTYQSFEFVIFDDGSTDGSAEELRDWASRDERIRLFSSDRNLGPAASSNAAVARARGELIARMDADDISHPDRLRRQVELLQERPDVGLVGTMCNIIDENGKKLRDPDLWRLTRRSWFAPFPHGSIMFRRKLFDHIGGYRDACVYWEDLDLALRASREAKVATLACVLYEHRQSESSTRLSSDQQRVERAVDLMYRSIKNLRRTGTYEEVLASHGSSEVADRIDPRVFISLGSVTLWSGRRTRLVKRLWSRSRLRLDVASASAIVWTAWASVSPGSLRWFLHATLTGRNRLAASKLREGALLEWKHPSVSGP